MPSFENDPRVIAARAQKAAAEAQLKAIAYTMTPEERGCSDPTCPGPYVGGGGCPLGNAGSCRRIRK